MTLTRKEPKPRTCKVCRNSFQPSRMGQKVCSPACALSLAKSERAKEEKRQQVLERKALRERKERIKSRQDWLREAQASVNRYVRLRDAHLGCVSCDRPAAWDGQWHASHLRSVGAASAVRFHLWNIHKACSICNNHLSGNLAHYRPRLVERIGADRVDWLESQTQLVRYDAAYLKRLKQVFAKKANRQERRNAARCAPDQRTFAAKRRELEKA